MLGVMVGCYFDLTIQNLSIFTEAYLVPHGGRTTPPRHHHYVAYIFWAFESLGSFKTILVIVVVVALFYVHSKPLWSFRDGHLT